MKMLILFVVLLSLIQPCRGVEFKNLNFQSPNVRRITEHFGFVRDIIPGWRLQIAEQDQDWMYYNNVCLSCPSAQLLGPESPRLGDRFTFTIKSGVLLDGYNKNMGSASIYQVGHVPEFAKSIHFAALVFGVFENLHVSLDGQVLQLQRFLDGDAGDFFGYQADVSAWAGRTAELRFTVGPGDYPNGVGGPLADIKFSPIPVPAIPEPSTWALLATGLAALGWATRNSKQRPAN